MIPPEKYYNKHVLATPRVPALQAIKTITEVLDPLSDGEKRIILKGFMDSLPEIKKELRKREDSQLLTRRSVSVRSKTTD